MSKNNLNDHLFNKEAINPFMRAAVHARRGYRAAVGAAENAGKHLSMAADDAIAAGPGMLERGRANLEGVENYITGGQMDDHINRTQRVVDGARRAVDALTGAPPRPVANAVSNAAETAGHAAQNAAPAAAPVAASSPKTEKALRRGSLAVGVGLLGGAGLLGSSMGKRQLLKDQEEEALLSSYQQPPAQYAMR